MRKGQTKNDPKIYLVWELYPIEDGRPQLRAVDLSKDLAKMHKEFLESETDRKISIEERRANHCFGKNALGARRLKR